MTLAIVFANAVVLDRCPGLKNALQAGGVRVVPVAVTRCVLPVKAPMPSTLYGQGALQLLASRTEPLSTHSTGRQAADTALQSAAVGFASKHRHDGAVLLVSNDQGFAGLLQYTRNLGCLNISVGARPCTVHIRAVGIQLV